MGQITVYSGPERRRRWSDEQRLQILTEAFAPGASPTDVARRHEISTGQLYTWRKKLSVSAVAPVSGSDGCPGFAEAVIVDDHLAAMPDIGAALVSQGQDRYRPIMGLCARRSALCRGRSAGDAVPLLPRSPRRASARPRCSRSRWKP